MLENKLKTIHDKSTKDIVGISFSYGTRSYAEELSHLEKTAEKYKDLDKNEIVQKINDLIKNLEEHPERCIKKSNKEIRDIFYQNGVNILYETKDKHGNINRKSNNSSKTFTRSLSC